MSEKPLPDARPRHRAAAKTDECSSATQATSAETGAGTQSPAVPVAATPEGPVYPASATLHWSENQQDYENIRAYFFSTMNPSPGVETMLVDSIVDHTREIRELERIRKVLGRVGMQDQLLHFIAPTQDIGEESGLPHLVELVNKWGMGEPDAEKEVGWRLELEGLSVPNFELYASAIASNDLERVGSMIEKAERRRDRMVKTFEQSRALHSMVNLRKVQMQRAAGALVSDADAPAIDGTFTSVDWARAFSKTRRR